jgi:hypothetical protein
VTNGTVTKATAAQESFVLGKVHKDIAMALVDAAGDEEMSDLDTIKVRGEPQGYPSASSMSVS